MRSRRRLRIFHICMHIGTAAGAVRLQTGRPPQGTGTNSLPNCSNSRAIKLWGGLGRGYGGRLVPPSPGGGGAFRVPQVRAAVPAKRRYKVAAQEHLEATGQPPVGVLPRKATLDASAHQRQ
ncbi:hypothetical protein GCM10010267_00050 [Streptomyces griseorubens]|nr:hypothetical protein GCM10010267_00050 [Streptomyces griseorubens]